MSRSRAVEALVIGAGPAGSAVAAGLAAAGYETLLVDRGAFPRDKACAEYMSPAAVEILHRMGVLPALESAGGVRIRGTAVHAPYGGSLLGRFGAASPAPFRPEGLSISRRLLDHRLLLYARAAGAEVWENARATPAVDGGSLTGAAIHGPDGRVAVSARLTIGADGLGSRVAAAIGGRRRGPLRRYAFVAHARDVSGISDTAEMHVAADGYVGLNPIGEGVTNVALVVPERRARAARGRPLDFMRDALEAFPELGGRVTLRDLDGPVRAVGPFAVRARRPVFDGGALVGDAAEFFDPFTGEGIHAALKGAGLLVAHASEALTQSRGTIRARDLAGYRRARRRAFGGKWIVERVIGYGMLWPWLFDRAVTRIGRRAGMADTLIGVTGDFVPPGAVLNPSYMARMLW